MPNHWQPNILWITTDQQRWDTLGTYGNPWVSTPNLDRIASQGVRFDNAFCQSPVCSPSRGAFLTGRYPRTCRMRQNGAGIPDDEVLVTRLFADAGYRCGLAGKLHLSPCFPPVLGAGGRERRVDDGYEIFHWSHHDAPLGDADNDYQAWLTERGITWSQEPVWRDSPAHTSMSRESSQMAWCTDRALEFVESAGRDDRPWLFTMNPFDPHAAFNPPAEFLEPYLDRLDEIPLPAFEEGELDDKPRWQRTDHDEGAYGGRAKRYAWNAMSEPDHRLVRAAYWAMCDQIDFHVGRLMDALEAEGQRQDTVVVFTSDHGELLGDHGIYMKGPFFYECSVRVPLIVSMPGTISSQTSPALVELLDLPQTLLDAAGLGHHPGMMGKSLWPLLTGAVDPMWHRDDVYCEFYNACEGHNANSPEPARATMIRTESHKLVRAHHTDEGELYDLAADAGEHRNLFHDPESVEVRQLLSDRLADRMSATVDPLPPRIAPW